MLFKLAGFLAKAAAHEIFKDNMRTQLNSNAQDTDIYRFQSELCNYSFKESKAREQSIIDQAGKMQLAFSFVIIAVLTAYGFTLQLHSCYVFHKFCFIMLVIISLMLILSLGFATFATYRFLYKRIDSVEEIEKYVNKEKTRLHTVEQQAHSRNGYLKKVQNSIDKNNDKRVTALLRSMNLFFIALASIVVTIIVGIYIF